MIVEFSKVLIQTDTGSYSATEHGSEDVEPHLINGVRYHWNMHMRNLRYRETFQEWIVRTEEMLMAPKYKNIVGVVICDVVGIVGNNSIMDEYQKEYYHGSLMVRYAYLNDEKKSYD